MHVYEFLLLVEFSEECHLGTIDFWSCINDFKGTVIQKYHFLSDAIVDEILYTSIKHSEYNDPNTWEAEIHLASFIFAIGYQIGLTNGSHFFHEWPVISSCLFSQQRVSWSRIQCFHIDALQLLLNTWRTNATVTPNLLPDSNWDQHHYIADINDLVELDLPNEVSYENGNEYDSFSCVPPIGNSFVHYDHSEEQLTLMEDDTSGEEDCALEVEASIGKAEEETASAQEKKNSYAGAFAMYQLSWPNPVGQNGELVWMP